MEAPVSGSRRRKMSLRDFFQLLCTLINPVNCVQDPKGRSLVAFLGEKTQLSGPTVTRNIDELASLGYLEKQNHKKRFWRVRILEREWDDGRYAEFLRVAREQKKEPPATPAVPAERTFAVFMDYKNLESNLKNADKFRDFSWLLDPILEQGKIIFAFVFIPDHYFTRAPIQQLSNLHRFQVIACPRQIGGAITKDADTVDAKIDELAWPIIEHSNVTDLVIISGDADFKRLANLARWRQKNVIVISAARAVSGRFFEMEKAGIVQLELI